MIYIHKHCRYKDQICPLPIFSVKGRNQDCGNNKVQSNMKHKITIKGMPYYYPNNYVLTRVLDGFRIALLV